MKNFLNVILWAFLGVLWAYVLMMAIITPDKDESGEIMPAKVVLFGKK